MKNVELTCSERIRIAVALEHERERIEENVKFCLDKANSNVEKKSLYESFAQDLSNRINEINQIINKLTTD